MKSIKTTLGKNIRTAKIHIMSDWHIGDRFCNLDKIKQELKEIEQDPEAYVILNGDLINNATKTSVSDCYAEESTPMEQVHMLLELLGPIKNKILLVTNGNHEARTYKTDGIDLTQLVCMQLGLEKKYCKEGGVLFLRMGTNLAQGPNRPFCYVIYSTHGSGGGRKEGSKAVRLADMASIVDADIYIHSHTHLPMIMKQGFFRTCLNTSSVTKVEKLFVNTAAQLEYGGYGQTYEFKPSSTASPVIYLSGTKKEFTARL